MYYAVQVVSWFTCANVEQLKPNVEQLKPNVEKLNQSVGYNAWWWHSLNSVVICVDLCSRNIDTTLVWFDRKWLDALGYCILWSHFTVHSLSLAFVSLLWAFYLTYSTNHKLNNSLNYPPTLTRHAHRVSLGGTRTPKTGLWLINFNKACAWQCTEGNTRLIDWRQFSYWWLRISQSFCSNGIR